MRSAFISAASPRSPFRANHHGRPECRARLAGAARSEAPRRRDALQFDSVAHGRTPSATASLWPRSTPATVTSRTTSPPSACTRSIAPRIAPVPPIAPATRAKPGTRPLAHPHRDAVGRRRLIAGDGSRRRARLTTSRSKARRSLLKRVDVGCMVVVRFRPEPRRAASGPSSRSAWRIDLRGLRRHVSVRSRACPCPRRTGPRTGRCLSLRAFPRICLSTFRSSFANRASGWRRRAGRPLRRLTRRRRDCPCRVCPALRAGLRVTR